MFEAQKHDQLLQDVKKCISEGRIGDVTLDALGAIWFHGHLFVPLEARVKMTFPERHITLLRLYESGYGKVYGIMWGYANELRPSVRILQKITITRCSFVAVG